MNIDQIVVTVLVVAIILAFMNLYASWRDQQKSEAGKQLKNLYYPLHSIIAKKNKYVASIHKHSDEEFEKFATEYYKYFLELQNRYLENKIYESPKLARAFSLLIHKHGMEAYSDNEPSHLPEEVIKNLALFELKYQVDDDGLSLLERNLQKAEEVIESDVSKMIKRL